MFIEKSRVCGVGGVVGGFTCPNADIVDTTEAGVSFDFEEAIFSQSLLVIRFYSPRSFP